MNANVSVLLKNSDIFLSHHTVALFLQNRYTKIYMLSITQNTEITSD